MAVKYDTVVNELNTKIDKLIKLYIISLEQNENLKQELENLRSELEGVKRENKILNENIKTSKVASAISGGEKGYEAKVRINQLVREIDRCITLLNN